MMKLPLKVAFNIVLCLGFNIQSVAPERCYELKRSHFLTSDYEIACPDVNHVCTWFRIENGSRVSVEPRFRNSSNNSIVLLRNDRYGYGLFDVITSQSAGSRSLCYKVCPVANEYICDNCSDIIINNEANPSEVELCAGENMSIAIVAPPIFNISQDYHGASLRLNGSNLERESKCWTIGSVNVPSLIYHCENLQEIDSGIYTGHNLISCDEISLEWCTQNVSVKVKNCFTNITTTYTSTTVQTPNHSISLSITFMESTISVTKTATPITVTPGLIPTISSTPMIKSEDDENTGLIAGVAVSTILVILVILVTIIAIGFVCWRNSQRGDYDVAKGESKVTSEKNDERQTVDL